MLIKMLIVGLLILITAVTMTSVGKGGGNFYVLILSFGGLSIYQAATTGQFILFGAALAATLVFHKNKNVFWSLAFLVGGIASLFAFFGGYFSHFFSGTVLKLIFGGLLILAAILMLFPIRAKKHSKEHYSFGFWRLKAGDQVFYINLWITVSVSMLTGFASGLVGVAGGSFLVPILVLACELPMQMAVGTVSVLLMGTSLMGFVGHVLQGDFSLEWSLPLVVVTIIGGIVGGKLALRSQPKHLKRIFAISNILAAVLMLGNAFFFSVGS